MSLYGPEGQRAVYFFASLDLRRLVFSSLRGYEARANAQQSVGGAE